MPREAKGEPSDRCTREGLCADSGTSTSLRKKREPPLKMTPT